MNDWLINHIGLVQVFKLLNYLEIKPLGTHVSTIVYKVNETDFRLGLKGPGLLLWLISLIIKC